MTIIFDTKIYLIICEPDCVKFICEPPIVKLFDFLIPDIFMIICLESNVTYLVVDVFSQFSELFTEYVNIYLGDAGVNLYIFLPESSNAMWN